MNNMNIVEKVANAVSSLLDKTAEESSKISMAFLVGEPEFPIDLLKEKE